MSRTLTTCVFLFSEIVETLAGGNDPFRQLNFKNAGRQKGYFFRGFNLMAVDQ